MSDGDKRVQRRLCVCLSVCLSVCPLGERGVRQVPGRMLSQDVLEQVSVAAQHNG